MAEAENPYRRDMGTEFRRLVPSLGVEYLHLHDLRHIGPSVLLMQGIPGDVVRTTSSPRSSSVTHVVTHPPSRRRTTTLTG